jgi:ABC-type Mn2+/Zn2+ transport system permease subunit
MRGRAGRVSDRAIGITLGIVLGIAVILLFLFLGSRNTIDEPSLSGNATQTQTHPATPPAGASKAKPPK